MKKTHRLQSLIRFMIIFLIGIFFYSCDNSTEKTAEQPINQGAYQEIKIQENIVESF